MFHFNDVFMLKFLKTDAVQILPSKKSWNCCHPEDFWNAVRQHSHSTRVKNPGIVTIRRTFGMRCANTRTTWE
jgi:hypothetical protein